MPVKFRIRKCPDPAGATHTLESLRKTKSSITAYRPHQSSLPARPAANAVTRPPALMSALGQKRTRRYPLSHSPGDHRSRFQFSVTWRLIIRICGGHTCVGPQKHLAHRTLHGILPCPVQGLLALIELAAIIQVHSLRHVVEWNIFWCERFLLRQNSHIEADQWMRTASKVLCGT